MNLELELWKLIAKWRKDLPTGDDECDVVVRGSYENCANDLEALISPSKQNPEVEK